MSHYRNLRIVLTLKMVHACGAWFSWSEPDHSHNSIFPFALPTAKVPNFLSREVPADFFFASRALGSGSGAKATAPIEDGV